MLSDIPVLYVCSCLLFAEIHLKIAFFEILPEDFQMDFPKFPRHLEITVLDLNEIAKKLPRN